jgi:hypothetical protein
MGCLGVHFALTKEEVDALRGLPDDGARLDHLQSVIEEEYFAKQREFTAESDKAWDAMHRALTDGQLTWDGGEEPLNRAVLGGELLYDEDDYIMSLKTPIEVADVAVALRNIDEPELRKRYFAIDAESYDTPLSDEDFEYTWHWFERVRDLYERAARAGRFVLFTADQ